MKTALNIVVTIWRGLPEGLRRYVGYGLSGGIVASFIVLSVQFASTGWLNEQLGLNKVAKAAEVSAQLDDLKSETVQLTTISVNHALQNYTDSLAKVRKAAEDTILTPMLQSLVELNRRVGHIERSQGTTNRNISAYHMDAAARLERLARQAESPSADPRLLDVLDRLNERMEALEQQRQEPPGTPRKNAKPQKY